MRITKKILNLFLVFCLLLSQVPLSVMADETGTDNGSSGSDDHPDGHN